MTSSSSLPSFPSTLSWSRDESARRVKYTLTCLLSGGGAVLLGALCFPWPSCPSTNCPSVLHEAVLTPVSQHSGAWAHAHARVCPKRSPFGLTPRCSVSLNINSVRSSPYNIYLKHTVFLNLQKISWVLVKYCSKANMSNLSRATVIRYLDQLKH